MRLRRKLIRGQSEGVLLCSTVSLKFQITDTSRTPCNRSRVDDSRRVEELTATIQKHTYLKERRVRALRPWGDDKELLAAVNHGDFLIYGFRNRDLLKLLYRTEAESIVDRRRRSAAISRQLRTLKAHKIIQKVHPGTHRYQVTELGRIILVAVLTTAQTSVHQINQLVERKKAA